MKRFVVAMAALAVVACTETKQSAQPTMTEREVRQANRLPAQNAREMASPYQGLGCIWPVSLEPARITPPNELSATCDALPSGRTYLVRIDARVPAAAIDTGSRMRLRVSAPGISREVEVAFAEQIGPRLRFSGEAEGRVPNGSAVEVKLSLIGCEDATGNAAPCAIESGSLFVLSRSPR